MRNKIKKTNGCTPDNMHLYMEELGAKVDYLTKIVESVFKVDVDDVFYKSNPVIRYYNKQTRKYDECRLMDVEIRYTTLPVRAKNVLQQLGVDTIGELTNIKRETLLKHRNFGKKTMQEIDNFLEQYKLSLNEN